MCIAVAFPPHHEQEAAKANSILNTQGKELASVEDRSVDILRSISFGPDFHTLAKMVLEAMRTGSEGSDDREGSANSVTYSIAVNFDARMVANIYWDAVEHEKERHKWAQNCKDI